jgi:glyoxylase-like metal-dependent hydrolase (beta-lactamase superfamily II)
VNKRSACIEQMIADWEARPKMEGEQRFVAPHPNEVFEDSMTLMVGGTSLHLIHAPGHTTDHLVAYHPESGTLWAADMLDDLLVPYASDLTAYKQTLAMLSKWDIRVLVPAHGSPTADTEEIRARILKDMTYVEEVEDSGGDSSRVQRYGVPLSCVE